MCDGGVATWNRSSGPRPSAAHQCDVARPIDACVWRTALGNPVVPELKTRITSSAAPASAPGGRRRPWASAASRAVGSSRSVTASPPRRSASSEAAAPSATAWRGPAVSSKAWSTSAAFHAGLRSTPAAPSLLMALTVTTNSGRFAIITATRSPRPTPRSTRCRAKALPSPSRSRNDQRSSPARMASRSPYRSAARSSPPCTSVAIGNIVLGFRDRRQHRSNVGFAGERRRRGREPEARVQDAWGRRAGGRAPHRCTAPDRHRARRSGSGAPRVGRPGGRRSQAGGPRRRPGRVRVTHVQGDLLESSWDASPELDTWIERARDVLRPPGG